MSRIITISVLFFLLSCSNRVYYPGHPKLAEDQEMICHRYYCFVYNDEHLQSEWMYYLLSSEMIVGDAERLSSFLVDTMVKTGTARNQDYVHSGFDRGHLVPAGDMVFCDTAMRESFFLSNISPQTPAFNRGIWSSLEQQVRDYAENFKEVYVVTGPVLKEGLETIGESEVSVPEDFYKAVLVYNDSIQQGIGFILPNEAGTKNSLYCYSISLDSLESITDIEFFPLVNRRYKKNVFHSVDTLFWKQ